MKIMILLFFIPLFAFGIGSSDRTINTETITTKKANQDITITPTGTGDVVLKAYTGFLKWASGVPTEQSTILLDSEVSNTLPIANGGTNSSTTLSNSFVMESVGGAIVESATTSTQLSYLDATSSIQTQLNTKLSTVDLTSDVTGILPIANGGTGSATQNFVDLSASQSIAGVKTFSVDSLWSGTGQLDIPSGTTAQRSGSPNAGMFRFNSENVQFEGYDGTTWGEIGGAGAGGINYLAGADTNFEAGVGNWTSTDLVNVPVGIITSPSALRGSQSLGILKGAADYSGDYVSVTFTIEKADLAKKIIISFDKDFSDSNLADDDLAIDVVKDPAGTPVAIPVNGSEIKAGEGVHYAQFQTDATELDYELRIRVNSTNASGYTAIIDNVTVGPQVITHGTIVTDPINYTPTFNSGFTIGTGGNASQAFRYWREGKHLLISGGFRLGSSGASIGTGSFSMTIPSGLAIDTASMELADGYPRVGSHRIADAGGVARNGSVTLLGGSTTTFIFTTDDNSFAAVASAVPWVWAQDDLLTIHEIRVPIQGWSSNAKMSEDFSGRDVVAEASGNDSDAIATGEAEDIPFKITNNDTTSSWSNAGNTGNNTADAFTVPETGYYSISGNVYSIAAVYSLKVYINGSYSRLIAYNPSSTAILPFDTMMRLTKGQVLTLRPSSAITLQPTVDVHFISITRLASPQTQLENELVAAKYSTDAGQSINSSTKTTLVFEDLGYDTHNMYNTTTGIGIIPITGKYSLCGFQNYSVVTWSAGQISYLEFQKNGASERLVDLSVAEATVGIERSTGGCSDIDFIAGETFQIMTYQSTGGTTTINNVGNQVYFSIHRIK